MIEKSYSESRDGPLSNAGGITNLFADSKIHMFTVNSLLQGKYCIIGAMGFLKLDHPSWQM